MNATADGLETHAGCIPWMDVASLGYAVVTWPAGALTVVELTTTSGHLLELTPEDLAPIADALPRYLPGLATEWWAQLSQGPGGVLWQRP